MKGGEGKGVEGEWVEGGQGGERGGTDRRNTLQTEEGNPET